MSHFCSILTMTMLRSQNARALRMKLVDDLWNTGFLSGCVPFWSETAKNLFSTLRRNVLMQHTYSLLVGIEWQPRAIG